MPCCRLLSGRQTLKVSVGSASVALRPEEADVWFSVGFALFMVSAE